MSEREMPPPHMEAYWFGFTPTGCESIDRILEAVVKAGDAHHSTEGWADPCCSSAPAETCVEMIQRAANDAAITWNAAPRDQHDDMHCELDCAGWRAAIEKYSATHGARNPLELIEEALAAEFENAAPRDTSAQVPADSHTQSDAVDGVALGREIEKWLHTNAHVRHCNSCNGKCDGIRVWQGDAASMQIAMRAIATDYSSDSTHWRRRLWDAAQDGTVGPWRGPESGEEEEPMEAGA